MALVRQVAGNVQSFCALDPDGCWSWGFGQGAPEYRIGVTRIQSSEFAFAGILRNGSCAAWGVSNFGGDCSAVQDQLNSQGLLSKSLLK